MAYSHEDYLRDCLIEKEGSGRRSTDAGLRKKYFELNRIDLIYKNFPEYQDNSESYKGVYDDMTIVINDRLYTEKDLTEWAKYTEGTKLYNLLLQRSSMLKWYKAYFDVYLESGDSTVSSLLQRIEKDIIELESEIYKTKYPEPNVEIKKSDSENGLEMFFQAIIIIVIAIIAIYIFIFIWNNFLRSFFQVMFPNLFF